MTVYYQDTTVTLHHGHVLDVLPTLPDGSVDCVVTSPPYYSLRDYGVDGQIGAEATPAEYIEAIRSVFAEVRRVIADDATVWINLGDSYATSGPSGQQGKTGQRARRTFTSAGTGGTGDRPPKNLLGLPWRIALALQDDGWILRRDVIWAKRNTMPEPVTDRPATAHEYLFLLTKSPQYWYDADAIREESDPEQEAHNLRYAKRYAAFDDRAGTTGVPGQQNNAGIHSRPGQSGRHSRSVWTISSEPFPGAHFATFPSELPRRCIVAGCKPGGTVLDPFHGSGTTGMVATRNGRKYVGIELNKDYLDLSLRTRLADGVLDFGDAS